MNHRIGPVPRSVIGSLEVRRAQRRIAAEITRGSSTTDLRSEDQQALAELQPLTGSGVGIEAAQSRCDKADRSGVARRRALVERRGWGRRPRIVREATEKIDGQLASTVQP